MATQGGTSRLGQMQMRFQAKLQKEADQKRNELNSPGGNAYYRTTTTTSVSNTGGGIGNGSGGGKVRQLFEERRQRGVGIDKSYPLQPINSSTTSSTTTTKRTVLDNGRPSPLYQRTPATTSSTRTITRSLPGGGHSTTTRTVTTTKSDSNNNLDDVDFHQPRGHGLNGKFAALNIGSEVNNNGNGSIRLKPVSLPVNSSAPRMGNGHSAGSSPGSVFTRRTVTTTTSVGNGESPGSNGGSSFSSRSSPSGSVAARTPTKAAAATVKSAIRASPKATTPVKKSGPPAENMAECRICGRYFNEDRVEKHETICEKSKTKKRKVFDTTKHRVKGTDAESYVMKKGRTGGAATQRTVAGVPVKSDAKKGNWRKKHEEFIAAIRAAKEMQAHLAKGGKLSDLPPPPPSENPDYIQCPHCSRRFNEAAATRHIPKCATMLHNKPKAAPVKRRF